MEKNSTILNDEILSKSSENSIITSSSSSIIERVSASGIDDNNDTKNLINVKLTNLSSDKNRVIRKIKLINPEKIQKIDVKQKIAEALKKFHESNNTSNKSEINVNKLSDNINQPKKSSSVSSSLHKNESELLSKLDKNEKSLRIQSVKSILNKKLKEKAKNESKIQAECSNSIKNVENFELKIDKEIKKSDNSTSILNTTNTESFATLTKPGRKIKPKPNLKISKTVRTSNDKISTNVQDNNDHSYSSNIQRNNTDLFESPSYSPIGHSPVSTLIIKEEEIEENGSEKSKLNEVQQQIKEEKEEENNFYGFSDDMVTKKNEIIIKKLTDFLEKQKIHNEKDDFNHSSHTNINENHRTNVIPSFSNLKSYLFEKWQNNEGKQQKNTQNDQNISKSKDKNNVTVVIEVNKPKNNEPTLTEEVVVEQQKQEIIVPNEMANVKTEKINTSEKRSYRRKVTPISVKKRIDENKSKKLIESVEKLPENISISSNTQIINSKNSIEINKNETNNSSNLTINQGDVQMKLIDPILSADKIQNVVENITSQSSCNTNKSNEILCFSSTSISPLPSSSSTAPVAILIPKIIKESQNITSTNSKLNKYENKNSIDKYENSVVQRKLKVQQQHQPKQQKSLLKKSIKPVNRFKTNLQTVSTIKRKLKSSKKIDKQSGIFTTASEGKNKRILFLRVKDILKAKEISIEKVQEVINQQVSEFVGTKIDLGKNYAIKALEKLEAKSKLQLILDIEDIMNKSQKYNTLDILCKNEKNDLQLNEEKIKLYNILNVPVKDELDEKCLVIENNSKEMKEVKALNAVDFLLNYSDNMKFDNNDNADNDFDLIINISDDDDDDDDDYNNCDNDYNVIEIDYDNDEIITMKKDESKDNNEQNNKNVAEIINVNNQNYVYMMNSTPIVLEDKLLTEQEKIKIFSLNDCEQISLQDEIIPSGGIMKIKNEDKALEIALQNQFIFSPSTNDTSNILESRDCSNSIQIDDLIIDDFKIEENQFDTEILNTEQIENSKLNEEDKSKIQLTDDDELLNVMMNELSKIIPDSNESNCKTEKENLLYKIEDIKIENIQNTENAYPSNIKPIDPKCATAASSKKKKIKRKRRTCLSAIIKTKSNFIQNNVNKNRKKFVKLSKTNIKENSISELKKYIKTENVNDFVAEQIDDIKKEGENSRILRILSEIDDGDDDDDDDEKLYCSLNRKPNVSAVELKRKLLKVFSKNFKKKTEKMNTLKKKCSSNTVRSFKQFSQKYQKISNNIVNADGIDEISKQYNSLIADNEIQSKTNNCDDDDESRDVQNTATNDEQLISEKCCSREDENKSKPNTQFIMENLKEISEEESKKLNEENVEIKNISLEKEKEEKEEEEKVEEGKDKTILNKVSSPLSTTRSGRKIKLTEKIASFNLVKMKKITSTSSVTKMMTTREDEQNEIDVIDPKCISNEKNLENILQNEQIEQQLKEKESEKMHETEEKSTEVIDDHHQFSDDNFELIEENLKCLGEGNRDESDEENDHCTNVLTATQLNVNVLDAANNENENDNLLSDKSLNEIDNVKSFQLELLQSLESPKRRNTFKDTTTTAADADINFNANVTKKSRTISLSSTSKENEEKIGIKFSVKYGDNSDNKIKSDNEELLNLLKKKTMVKYVKEKPIKSKKKDKKYEIIKHESRKRKREDESDQNKSINKVEKNPTNSEIVVDKISSESKKRLKKSKSISDNDDDNELEPDTKEMYDMFIKTIKFDNFEHKSKTSIKCSRKPKSDVKRKSNSVNTKKINTANDVAKDLNSLKENKINETNETNENSIEILTDNKEDDVEIIESNEQNNTIKIELNESDNSVSPIKDNNNEKQYQEEKLDDDRKLHPRLLLITDRSDLDNDNPTSLEIQNENKTPEKNELKCGLCKEIVGIKSWVTHLSVHYGIGWREGIDQPINVESYRSVLLACQRYFKENKVKSLKCRLCGILRKSALGLLGHLELCNLTKEEKLKQFVKCEYCDKSYPPWTIMQHQRFSCSNRFKNDQLQKEQEQQQQQQQNDSNNLDVSFSNLGRYKRQSVIKAEKKFAEDNIDEKLISDDDKCANLYNAPCRSILLWRYRGQIKNNGFAKCIGVNCDYMSSNEKELIEHNDDCTKVIRKGYACIECNYLDIEMDNVIQHYKDTHKKRKISKQKIHVHASESEAEIDSESSEDENIDDDIDDDDNVSGDDDDDDYIKSKYDLDNTYNNRRKKKKNKRKNKNKILNLNETNSENKNWKKLIEYEGHQDQTKLSLEKTLEFNKYNYSVTPLYEFAIPILGKINNPLETYFPNNLHSIKFAYNTKNTFNNNFGSSKLPNNNNTDTIDNNEWQQMNRFTIKSISSNEKLLFIGGPVTIMKWLPLPKSIEIEINKQYLLVTCKRDLYEFTKCINQELIKTIILIYEFDMKLMKLNKNYIPKLLYGIIYDYGPIHNIELIESGGYSIELNRLGLMAIGCIKSNIEIYSLPIKASKNCDDNNYCHYYDNNDNSTSSSNCNNINNSNNIKIDNNDNKLLFINLKSSIILKLDMKELNIDNDISKFYKEAQCLKICWSKAKNHNIIGGAYSNGFISLWNIDDDDENLSKFMINDIRNFVTISYFQATTSLITGFEFHYDMNGLRWLFITVKWKEALLFDVQDLTIPKLIMTDSLELCKGPINGTIWPVIWESPLYFGTHRLYNDYGYINSLSPLNIHYSTRRILKTTSEVLTIDYNSLRHILLAGTINGDFYLFNPTTLNLNLNLKSKIYDRLYLSYTDLIKLDGNKYDDNYEYIQNEKNLYDSDYLNKYGLIMGSFKPNDENAVKKMYDNKRIPPPCMSTFVKINQVSSNHNEIGNKLIAFGYENGLIRIRKIS